MVKSKRDITKIVYYKIEDIKPAKYNPRVISDEELSGLRESIKEFGIIDPLIINKRSGVLIGGHQRLKAADLEGYTEVPVVELDLGDIKEMALNVALNSHTIQGKFDLELLHGVLDEIKCEIPELHFSLNMPKLEMDLKIDFKAPAEGEMPDLGSGDKSPIQQITFTLSNAQADTIKEALGRSKQAGEFNDPVNENSNGNALARICEAYMAE